MNALVKCGYCGGLHIYSPEMCRDMMVATRPVLPDPGLPDYAYRALGRRLSDACDELEKGEATESVFSIMTPTGEVRATVRLDKWEYCGEDDFMVRRIRCTRFPKKEEAK